MSLPEIRQVVAEVSDMVEDWAQTYDMVFSPSFNVTGGEPFLRQDIFEILEEIGRRGFAMYLLSNGTLVTSDKARRLGELGVKGVQVSIEGPEMIHEAVRGKGSYSSALKGVQHLLDAGLTVTLNATLSEMNAEYFMNLVDLASALGVQRLGFSRLVPSGKGRELLHRMLKAERVRELYEAIRSLKTYELKIVTGDPVASQMDSEINEPWGSFPTGGCAAGLSGLTLLPDGTITPCRRLPIPIGNIRRDSLREVWSTSEVLGALRDKKRYTGKCGRCKRWDACRGCRAIAYASSQSRGEHDYLAEDPQCFIEE
jgi:radical SAM protein with 4Fe4S-binding SPASM domain